MNPSAAGAPATLPAVRGLETEVCVAAPRPSLPYDPSVGPHELAWAYLLDLVFAHACTEGLARLRVELPSAALEGPVAERAEASASSPASDGHGVALLGASRRVPPDAAVAYLLGYGRLAPAALRRDTAAAPGWWPERSFSVYRASARLRGVPIRLAYLAGRPDLADRSMAGLRRAFYAEGRSPAYYHLTIWRRP